MPVLQLQRQEVSLEVTHVDQKAIFGERLELQLQIGLLRGDADVCAVEYHVAKSVESQPVT